MLIIADTPRLIIRTWQEIDLPDYASLLGETLSDNTGSDCSIPSSRAENELWCFQAEMDRRGWSRWAVELKEGRKLIGYCGFAPYGKDVELVWRFQPEFRGQGLVVEAAEAVAKLGFETFRFDQIISFTNPDNDFAQSVMLELGMTLECFEGWSSVTVARYSLTAPV